MFGQLMIFPGDPRFEEARVAVLKSARVCHQIAEHVLPVMRDQNVFSKSLMHVHDLPPCLTSSEHHRALAVRTDTGFPFLTNSMKRNHVQYIITLTEPDCGGGQI
jgi:hypothetical protein